MRPLAVPQYHEALVTLDSKFSMAVCWPREPAGISTVLKQFLHVQRASDSASCRSRQCTTTQNIQQVQKSLCSAAHEAYAVYSAACSPRQYTAYVQQAVQPDQMPQQHAAVEKQCPGMEAGNITAAAGSSSSHGILKWPKPGLTSTAAATDGPSGPPDMDSFFLDVEVAHGSNVNRNAGTSKCNSGSGSKQQKRALFIDPLCQPDSNDLPSRLLLTSSLYGQDGTAAHETAAGAGRGIYRASVLLDLGASAPAPACSQQQQRSGFSDLGQPHHSTSGISSSSGAQSSKLSSGQFSLQLPETPAVYHSNSGSPWTVQPRSNRSSFICGISRSATGAGNSTDDAGGGAGHAGNSSSGISSAAAGKLYGTAWYLKSKDWDRVTHEVEHGSTWHRKSVYIQELDELHRFAQQLEQLTDPNTSSSGTGGHSSTAEPPIAILAAARQGLNSPAATKPLSAISPETLATNTWATPKKGSLDETAAADAVVQHYKQLHHAAQQQAVMNEKIRGTHALRAYKEFMQSKGFRQAASLQRLPTPTDEDMRRVKVKEQHQLKRQQHVQHWHKHQQQQGSQWQQQQQLHHHQQQQQGRSVDGTAAAVGDAFAASAAIPSAAGTSSSSLSSTAGGAGAASSSGTNVVLCANATVTAPNTPGTSITGGATATVPRLNLAEVNRVTKQLSELKHSCNPESGLAASDWQLLEALLTGGRQALATAKAAASSRSSGGGAATSRVISSSSGTDCSADRGISSIPGGVSCSSKGPSTGSASLSSRDGSSSHFGGGSSSGRLAELATSRQRSPPRWRPSSLNSGSSSGSQPLSSSRKASSSGGSRMQLDPGQVAAAGLNVRKDVLHSSRPGTSSMFGSPYLTDRITHSADSPRARAAAAAAAAVAARATPSTAATDCQTMQHAGDVIIQQAALCTEHYAAKQMQLSGHHIVLQRQMQHRQQQAPSTSDFFLAASDAMPEGSSSSDLQQMQHQRQQQQYLPDAAVAGDSEHDANDDFDPDSIDLQELASHSKEQPQQPEATRRSKTWAGTSTTVDSAVAATCGDGPAVNAARSADGKQTAAAALQSDGGALRNLQQAPDWQLSPRLNSTRSSNSRDLPGLTSRSGAGRLSPYISPRVVEQVPMHINYTLSRGGSGATTARTASPARLSGAGSSRSTPRSRA